MIYNKARIGLIGGVVRGPPPASCRLVCMEDRKSEKCMRCPERPLKSVEISFGGEPSLDAAIRKGLTTPEQIEAFRKQITGES